MHEELLTIFTVVGGAAAIPLFSRRLRIPSSVCEIIYGIILFNFYLHLKPEWFSLLKEIGFIYLMFVVGMELDIKRLLKEGRFPWYIMIPALSLLLTPLIFLQMGYHYYLGLTVAVLSAGIIIPVLKESGLIKTETGRDITGMALVGELLTIILLTAIEIHHRSGFTITSLVAAIKLLLLLFVAVISLKILYVASWWNPEKVQKVMESEDPVEEGIRSVIAIAFAGAIIAYASGVEPVLGSFMAGLIFSYVFRKRERFEEKINAVGFGFFIPFFFIGVGADFNAGLLQSFHGIKFSLFLTAMIFLSNIFPLLLSRLMKIGNLEAMGMSLILSAPLSMIVVAATLGVKMGMVSDEVNGSLILAAILSSIIYPSIFRLISKRLLKPSSEPSQQSL